MANINGKYSAEEMINAIREANGILTVAARKLGCTRQTVHNYINKFSTVRQAYEDARETNIDYAEGKLMNAIKNEKLPAIMFFLRTVGRNRGYVERQEVDLRNVDAEIENELARLASPGKD